MPLPSAAAVLLEAWRDLDRALDGLSKADAERRLGAASPISWTIAHLAENVDRLVNDLFFGGRLSPYLGDRSFRFGATGEPADWLVAMREAQKVSEACRSHLMGLSEEDLDRRVPYDGSNVGMRVAAQKHGGVSLRYVLIRVALHHYYHIGEIVTARKTAGHDVGDFPGLLEACF